MMTEQKIQVGQRVLLPNGLAAVVTEAWNPHQTWGPQYPEDEWEYHVEFPSMGQGGRLNYKENELLVWKPIPGDKFGGMSPQQP